MVNLLFGSDVLSKKAQFSLDKIYIDRKIVIIRKIFVFSRISPSEHESWQSPVMKRLDFSNQYLKIVYHIIVGRTSGPSSVLPLYNSLP